MAHRDIPTSALLVSNPGAGSGGDGFLSAVSAACARDIAEVEQLELAGPADAVEQIASAVGQVAPELVISVGGDGTARTVAEGMARATGHWATEPPPMDGAEGPTLLVLPAGSGNSLYSVLWPETVWAEALDAVLTGTARRLRADLIRLCEADRASLLGTNFGLFADSAARIEQMKVTNGDISAEERYAMAFAAALDAMLPIIFRITVDGATLHHGVASMITVGGAPRFAGGKSALLPKAAIDDGLLDVCVVEAHTAAELTALAPLAVSGEHLGQPGVHYAQGREITVERLDGADLSVEHDGDPLAVGAAVTLGVLPGAVSLLAAPARG